MAGTLAHRGPDSSGAWCDPAAGIALGHRRLAVLDLSPQGHQPMNSHTGRWMIIFNGEIYNHWDLRAELENTCRAPRWRGTSDTETLLAALDAWHVEGTLRRLVGMFAFAAWDSEERVLHLVRDRMGEKPLYYASTSQGLLFGSELKGLRAHPACPRDIDRGALTLFLRHGYIPSPWSILHGVRKLPPGTRLAVSSTNGIATDLPEPIPYWTLASVAERGVDHPFPNDIEAAADRLEVLLSEAVAGQMLADVPVGAFLSGGIDSSLIVALMRAQSAHPVKTFTIGFTERRFDEADDAQDVAEHFGTDHTCLMVTPADARAVIPRLPVIYDEPFADSSQIPTFLVSQLARQSVTVALSGDGGDELFGGYERYRTTMGVWRRLRWIPRSTRVRMGRVLCALPGAATNALFALVGPLLPHKIRLNPAAALYKLGKSLDSSDAMSLYRALTALWDSPESAVVEGEERESPYTAAHPWLERTGASLAQRMMFLDGIGYLPGDILTKVDRAAMAVSLETRVPLLDHRVVSFAWRLPDALKQPSRGPGKRILRHLLARHLPTELFDRPKMGFGIPIHDWLREPLRDWAEELLEERRLGQQQVFRPEPVRRAWEDHLSGRDNLPYPLWCVLMFQAWFDEWGTD